MKDELNRLYKLYYERDKEFEKAKGRRFLLTVIGFTAWYFWLFCNLGSPRGWYILTELAIAVVFAIVHTLVNMTIFGYLHNKGREEGEILERIKKQIRELEKKQH